ncbi:MAG: hypothetical protein AB2531_16415 [Candidatus Thiodiazotropha sp.]
MYRLRAATIVCLMLSAGGALAEGGDGAVEAHARATGASQPEE